MITSDNFFLGNNPFPAESPQSSFYHVNDYFWHIISYGIHFLTRQRVSSILPSKSIIFLSKSLMHVPGCHINNIPLTISFKWFFKEILIFPQNLWSNPISPSGITSFTVMSSLSPLNGRNSKLGGFSISYVHVTSELTDSQVSSSSPVGTTHLPSCPVRDLWTVGLWV